MAYLCIQDVLVLSILLNVPQDHSLPPCPSSFPRHCHASPKHVQEELADVIVYCQNLLDKLGLDVDEIVNSKMAKNEAKYPVEKARGNAAKYDQL